MSKFHKSLGFVIHYAAYWNERLFNLFFLISEGLNDIILESTQINQKLYCPDEPQPAGANLRSAEDCIPLPSCPIGIDFENQKKFVPGKTCTLKRSRPVPTPQPEPTTLPFCPIDSGSDSTGINLRTNEDLVPGVTCIPRPFCPEESESDSTGINVRTNEDLVPGVTCIPLPFCPEASENDSSGINLRTNEDLVPGITCKLLPVCPEASDSNPQGINLRTNEDLVPGVTCRLQKEPDLPEKEPELPFCTADSDNEGINPRSQGGNQQNIYLYII